MSILEDYFSQLPEKQYKKGEVIFFQGDVPLYAYGIRSGVVKIYNVTTDGEEKCISYEAEYDIFPMCWLFSRTDKTLYYYQAHTDCKVGVIDKEAFHRDLRNDPTLMYEVFHEQMKTYVHHMFRINGLEQPRASIKLANTFRLLCLRHGSTIREHTVQLNVPLTQQEVAQFTGLTRETTATELKRLRSDGVISCQGKKYTIYTDKLNDILSDEFNPGVSIDE